MALELGAEEKVNRISLGIKASGSKIAIAHPFTIVDATELKYKEIEK